MRYLLFTDNHFCERVSIIQKSGVRYTQRIENQLESINWLESVALKRGCDAVICLGDFFDKASLTDEEITAVQDIKWVDLPHYFLVGNHEIEGHTTEFSSAKMLESPKHIIISEPKTIFDGNVELCFLPYILESDRKPLAEYFGKTDKKRVILSHNDLKGIQMGPVVSKTGFELDDIKANCDLFINGHLHNGQKLDKGILNLGNLTGRDFGEDAARYSHNVMILDTSTGKCELIENPYAFNFYQLEIRTAADFKKLNELKNKAVLSIKCKTELINDLRALLANLPNVVESRIIATHDAVAGEAAADLADLSMSDYVSKFIECCKDNIDNTKILDEELAEICK